LKEHVKNTKPQHSITEDMRNDFYDKPVTVFWWYCGHYERRK